MNSCGPARLRQIRTRESGGYYVRGRELFQVDNISAKVYTREMFSQNSPSRLPFFAEQFSAGTGLVKAEFKSTYTGEQSRYGKFHYLRFYRRAWHNYYPPT